jgi:hypothetical protein
MTGAATALLRLLLQRAGEERHRILLSHWSSVDWQSLTFTGERHEASFTVAGEDAMALAGQWTAGVGEDKFDLPSGFVAEIGVSAAPSRREDGLVTVGIEALTLAD